MNLARAVSCAVKTGGEVVASRARPLVRLSERPSSISPSPSLSALRATADGDRQASTSSSSPRAPRNPAPSARLDELTIERHPEHSRNVVQSWIAQGKVLVNGQPVTKAGTKVSPDVKVDIIAEQPKYVCRGGLKLEKALDEFEIDPDGLTALDAGLSSTEGSPTACFSAARTACTAWTSATVKCTRRFEPTRASSSWSEPTCGTYDRCPELVDLVTLDLSFISVLKVLPAVAAATRRAGATGGAGQAAV